MARTIWKYPLRITDWQRVSMQRGACILSAGVDPQGQLCIWAEVDPEASVEPRDVRIVGTGHGIDLTGYSRFVGSVTRGMFVWHIYMAARTPAEAQPN